MFRYQLPISRWSKIYKLIFTHIVLMILTTGLLFVGVIGGWIWFLLQVVIMPLCIVCIEHQLRKSNPPKNHTPTMTYFGVLVVMYTISLLTFGYIALSFVAYSTL